MDSDNDNYSEQDHIFFNILSKYANQFIHLYNIKTSKLKKLQRLNEMVEVTDEIPRSLKLNHQIQFSKQLEEYNSTFIQEQLTLFKNFQRTYQLESTRIIINIQKEEVKSIEHQLKNIKKSYRKEIEDVFSYAHNHSVPTPTYSWDQLKLPVEQLPAINSRNETEINPQFFKYYNRCLPVFDNHVTKLLNGKITRTSYQNILREQKIRDKEFSMEIENELPVEEKLKDAVQKYMDPFRKQIKKLQKQVNDQTKRVQNKTQKVNTKSKKKQEKPRNKNINKTNKNNRNKNRNNKKNNNKLYSSSYSQVLRKFLNSSVSSIIHQISNKSFHDLTSSTTILPSGTKSLLGLGLKFCPIPKNPETNFESAFEDFQRSLRIQWQFRNHEDNFLNKSIYIKNPNWQPEKAPPMLELYLSKVKHRIQNMDTSWKQKPATNLSIREKKVIHTLRNRTDLKIVQADKNLGPAIMEMDKYILWVLEHLQDKTTYKLITNPRRDIIHSLIQKVVELYINFVCQFPEEIKNAKIIIHQIHKKNLPYFHALPKLHKNPMGLRPIISACNSVFEGLSKWIDFQLRPIVTQTKTFLKDSDQILDIINNSQIQPTDIIFTVDVVSLYTTIPLDIALNRAIPYFTNTHPFGEYIIQGLELIMKNNYFEFGNSTWLQLVGTAMGTPCAPLFAILYVSYFEETLIIPTFKNNLIHFYRYIDDVFGIWRVTNEHSFQDFIQMLNTIPGLKWTYTINLKSTPFLDLQIIRNNNEVYTKTNQKELNLYLYVTQNSAHPRNTVSGLVKSLIIKYMKQNSKNEDKKSIILLLFRRLQERGYSTNQLRRTFKTALYSLNTTRSCKKVLPIKITYDPRAPSRTTIRKLFNLDQLQAILKHQPIGTPVIAYCTSNCLEKIIKRNKISEDIELPIETCNPQQRIITSSIDSSTPEIPPEIKYNWKRFINRDHGSPVHRSKKQKN